MLKILGYGILFHQIKKPIKKIIQEIFEIQKMGNIVYHVTIHLWTFLLTGFLVRGGILLTSRTQIIRAASANPVEILRHE